MKLWTSAVTAVLLGVALQAGAQNSSGGASANQQALQAERERLMIMQAQRMQEDLRQRAQERCVAQRGTNCDTDEGLREWMLLDRTREQAVLDRVTPLPAPR
jgi:hypothetical protein